MHGGKLHRLTVVPVSRGDLCRCWSGGPACTRQAAHRQSPALSRR